MDNEKYYLARENMWAAAREIGLIKKKDIADFAGVPPSRISELKNDNAIRWSSLNKVINAIVESGKGDYTAEWFLIDHSKPTIDESLITKIDKLTEIVMELRDELRDQKK